MVSVTPYGDKDGRAIHEILNVVNADPQYDNGAIFRRAISVKSIDAVGFLMGLWAFDDKNYAEEALRVLKAVLTGSPASTWIEPAISSVLNEPDGWVVIYSVDKRDHPVVRAAQEILASTPI